MTLKGNRGFGGKLTPGFQFSPQKILPISFQQARMWKFQTLWDYFVLKVHWFSQKLWQGFHLVTLKDHEKFGGKLTPGFQFRPGKIVPI